MKKLGLLFLLLILSSTLAASNISVTGDVMSLDGFFYEGKRVSATLGFRHDKVGIDLPFSYGFSLEEELALTDIALSLRLYPIDELELYFASDILSWIHLFGLDSPLERDIHPSSFSIGYGFSKDMFLLEGELVFQNPARLANTTLAFLADRFLCYKDIYFALKIGVVFDINANREVDDV